MTAARSQAQEARVVVELPIPDSGIGPNGRLGWREKAGLVSTHRLWAFAAMVNAHRWGCGIPWPAARMNIEWRYCGKPTDSDNIVARCKAYRDGVADARLVNDDRTIEIGAITYTRVKRADQCVRLTFERIMQP